MARIVSGQVVLSTVPAQLPSVPCTGVILHNDDAAINIRLGGSSALTTYLLGPGQNSGRIQCQNLNQVWAQSMSGTPTLSYLTS